MVFIWKLSSNCNIKYTLLSNLNSIKGEMWKLVLRKAKVIELFCANILLPSRYLFKVKNGNTSTMCKICLKLTIKTPEHEWRQWMTYYWCLYCQFWTDFAYCSGVSIADFEHVNAGWNYSSGFQYSAAKNKQKNKFSFKSFMTAPII